METLRPPRIETGLASAMRAGEAQSGDRSVVSLTPGGALLGVVDGLGHGEEAALAAKIAVSVVESHVVEPVVSLVRLCHEELRATRGAVVSLASIDAVGGVMTWVGVGNVQGILLRADRQAQPAIERLLVRGGVVGAAELPPLSEAALRIFPGDTLIFATDGIQSGFTVGLTAGAAPQFLASRILRDYARSTDDALVLTARYLEKPA